MKKKDFKYRFSLQIFPKSGKNRKKSGKKSGKTGHVQKIGTFAFSPNRSCPKNWEFHRNSLHIRVPILGHPVYSNTFSDLIKREKNEELGAQRDDNLLQLELYSL